MSKTAVVYTCRHTKPSVSNERFDWLSNLIYDVRPDYVVDLGDGPDMESLSTFDEKNPGNLVLHNYESDVDNELDAQERIRYRVKKNKVKRPAYYGFQGNHEYRINRALEHNPRLQGEKRGVNLKHLETDRFFDEYHEYSNGGPAIHSYDGVEYAHFLATGNFGSAMSGDYQALNMLRKRFSSITVGHSHKLNVYFRPDTKKIGLVAGCFKGAGEKWAGQANDEWWSGVIIKHRIENGWYDPEFVSYDRLKKEYSR